jgi:hypothetical protein
LAHEEMQLLKQEAKAVEKDSKQFKGLEFQRAK